MSQTQITIHDDVADLLGDTPEQIERHVYEVLVLDLYRRHVISAGRAAEILGMEKFAFIRWSGSRGIPFIDMTKEEWEEELRVLDTL
jgi:predicted HTH domain antitoxin